MPPGLMPKNFVKGWRNIIGISSKLKRTTSVTPARLVVTVTISSSSLSIIITLLLSLKSAKTFTRE